MFKADSVPVGTAVAACLSGRDQMPKNCHGLMVPVKTDIPGLPYVIRVADGMKNGEIIVQGEFMKASMLVAVLPKIDEVTRNKIIGEHLVHCRMYKLPKLTSQENVGNALYKLFAQYADHETLIKKATAVTRSLPKETHESRLLEVGMLYNATPQVVLLPTDPFRYAVTISGVPVTVGVRIKQSKEVVTSMRVSDSKYIKYVCHAPDSDIATAVKRREPVLPRHSDEVWALLIDAGVLLGSLRCI